MVDIRPFRGLRYDSELVSAYGEVLCPPYDVIPPRQKAALLARSPYNIVHLELGEGGGGDERYARAAGTLGDWLDKGVLVRDTEPALYLHDHHFLLQGCWHRRRGVVAAVGLGGGGIMPHEGTLDEPKQDRLRLLRATRTQISPIFILYDDPGGQAASLLEKASQGTPLLEASLEGERHLLWRITDPQTVTALGRHLGARPLIIADGHHRFECAQAYRQEQSGSGAGAWDFAMMSLVATDDPGLVILPVHRLVRGLDPAWLEGLEDRLAASFEVESIPVEGMSPEGIANLLGTGEMGVLGPAPGRLLRLGYNAPTLQPSPPEGNALSVNLLHRRVLEEATGAEIAYIHEATEAVRRLGEYQVAFLVSPLTPADVYRVARAGERLPGKSTYFHPKLPTGLVLFPAGGEL
ncbi:MAG: DUF1015 domain-containing protein [Dehalococcoidia bacterium]